MRLATVRTLDGTRAAVVDGGDYVLQDAPDVGALLAAGLGSVDAHGAQRVAVVDAKVDLLVARPDKIICVGLNYHSHAAETGLDVPSHPALFAKYRAALLPPNGDIQIPAISEKVDWEVELGLVIGAEVRNVSEAQAMTAVAGVTVGNDISMRDWQIRAGQWLQGKTFEASTPVGPELVTLDELDDPLDLHVWCDINGERKQDARTSDLIWSPAEIISYISQIITLTPGDIILTGTPGGIGARQQPPQFLGPDDVVRTGIDGVGTLENRCVTDPTFTA